jgi:hypothetical protein
MKAICVMPLSYRGIAQIEAAMARLHTEILQRESTSPWINYSLRRVSIDAIEGLLEVESVVL